MRKLILATILSLFTFVMISSAGDILTGFSEETLPQYNESQRKQNYEIDDYKTRYFNLQTIVDGDTTPSVKNGNYFITSSNTGATAITDLDNPKVGQVVCIICGSTNNASTIADAGNFTLSAAWSPDSVGDSITLYVKEDNVYYEIGRTNN